tara:strand:- start:10900 stop:11352 length:453 start_codon:yes stop_codon:yes gene_type:complete
VQKHNVSTVKFTQNPDYDYRAGISASPYYYMKYRFTQDIMLAWVGSVVDTSDSSVCEPFNLTNNTANYYDVQSSEFPLEEFYFPLDISLGWICDGENYGLGSIRGPYTISSGERSYLFQSDTFYITRYYYMVDKETGARVDIGSHKYLYY